MSTASERIKEGMLLRGLKQVDLVEKTGISKGALSSYISGRYVPKQNNTFLIAKALDVSEAWLMGADVPMEREPAPAASTASTFSTDVKGSKELTDIYKQLTPHNQRKALTYSKNLLSTQQMEEDLLAAHVRTDVEQTPEGVQHDLDIMNDDSQWE